MTRNLGKVLPILVICLILGMVGREIWQIVRVKNTLDMAASYLVGYLVTGSYDPGLFKTSEVQHRALLYLKNDPGYAADASPEYLSSLIANGQLKEDQRIQSAVLDAAHYFSALNVVNEFKDSLPNPEKLKIVICSDRNGYSYQAAKDKCVPFNDAGEDGGGVIVSISYPYKIGSGLGFDLGRYDFHLIKNIKNECFMASCTAPLVVQLVGRVPESYAMTLTGDNRDTRQIECRRGNPANISFPDSNFCTDSGASFVGFDAEKVTVTVQWDGGSYSEVVEPIYKVRYPNGLRCGGTCKSGTVRVELP